LIARNRQRYANVEEQSGDTPSGQPLVRLHYPDLPWKLEKEDELPGTSAKNPDDEPTDAAKRW
jgi:hypothetical protein